MTTTLGEQRIGETVFTMPSDTEVVATRAFDAPIELVFDAWTSARHVPNWMLGPDDATMPVCEIDLRPGGQWHFVWKGGCCDGMEMRGEYRQIERPHRLVNTERWGGDWPETLNTLELREENGRTVTVNTVTYPTREARDAASQACMLEGWAISYDRLAKYLRTLR